jgi:hypothetical protein
MSYNGNLLGGLAGAILMFQAACGLAAPGQTSEESETLKERLSDKASDKQRVDNCKVPLDRRGPKIRPEGCRQDEASPVPPPLRR